MLLNGDNLAGLLCCLADQLLIQRLDGVDVDDPCINAPFFQQLAGLDRLGHHQAGGHNGDVLAVAQDNALAQLEVVGLGIVKDRNRHSAKAQIDRANIGRRRADRRSGLDVVGRVDDDHARDGAHQGNVLTALMGCAVFSNRNTRMGRTDFDVQVRVTDRVAHLLKGAAGGEHRKGAGKRDHARRGKARCYAHHVALGDAAVDEAFRAHLFKGSCLGCARKVCVQHNQIWIFRRKLRQGGAVALACCYFFHFCHRLSLSFRPQISAQAL